MSVQKLVAEADKLLEKGKTPEGIAKLKAALAEEPLNQIVATKLANIHVQNRELSEAAKVYGQLAKRLSDAGKSQVAIAIFKQALELTPDDINLRVRFAQECESVGKLGDAFLQGQIALQYYLKRKKYFDAANLMPLMARSQPKDEKIKLAWVEVLHLSQAEQKLIHFLVAVCGPPGVVSQEFPVGGEPTTMSQALYEGLMKIVPFFPRDPRVAYTMAWAAYRRGRLKEFYHFLRESLRRDPDFSLSVLLLARVLAESQKMNEALFAYKFFKERMSMDKSVDMLTLNRLLESFVEKNGWIKFTEEMGDSLDAAGFLKAITGVESEAVKAAAKAAQEEKKQETAKNEKSNNLELPPAEIEIGLGSSDSSADQGMEIVLATGQTVADANKQQKVTDKDKDPMKMQAELIKAAIEATVAGMGGQSQNSPQTLVQPVVLPVIHSSPVAAPQVSAEVVAQAQAAAAASVAASSTPSAPSQEASPAKPEEPSNFEPTGEINFKGESVEFTSLIKMGDVARDAISSQPEQLPEAKNTLADEGATRVAPLEATPEQTRVAVPAASETPSETTDKTAMQVISTASEQVEEAGEEPEDSAAPVKKKLFNPMEQMTLPDDMPSLSLESKADERTQMFDPIDVLDAAKVMKNRELADVETRSLEIPKEFIKQDEKKSNLVEIPEADRTRWRKLQVTGERTEIFSPVEAVKAGSDSRRPMDAAALPSQVAWKKDPAQASPEAKAEAEEKAKAKVESESNEAVKKEANEKIEEPNESNATMLISRPSPTIADSSSDLASEGEATRVLIRPAGAEQEIAEKSGAIPVQAEAAPASEPEKIEETASHSESSPPAIMPIPEASPNSENLAGANEEKVDLGDDLLEGATRIFTQPTSADKTEHLIKEIKKEMKQKANAYLNIEMLMKKAERYTAKRNYYLARKSLRHAQALGADEEVIKTKLREIRKLEFPEGLYNTISSDRAEKVDTSEVLDRLEQEFDLAISDESGAGPLGKLVDARIEAIFLESDPRTILDFGVGLQEMGLYRQAETLLMRLVAEFPEYAFDAYYLAAMSKVSRRDYAGAASILKRLSSDVARSEQEKIQIYYALGETFEKMQQPDRSRKFFEKVAELDANYRNVRHKLED